MGDVQEKDGPLRSFNEIYESMKDTPEYKHAEEVLRWSERALLAEEVLTELLRLYDLEPKGFGPHGGAAWERAREVLGKDGR